MIIGTFRLLRRDVVIEYNPAASWKSWERYHEGTDTLTYLGKIELTATKVWKRQKNKAIAYTVITGLTVGAVATIVSPAAANVVEFIVTGGFISNPQ